MGQKYLFQEIVWKNLAQQISNSRRIYLFIDYDGTIVPIKKQPRLAMLPINTRAIIAQLGRNPNIFVGLITGRSLTDIRNLVRIGHILYAANHGFQIHHNKQSWIHPDAKRVLLLLTKVEATLIKALIPIKGILLENKGLTLSVHYRNVRASDVYRLKIKLKQIIQPYRELLKLTSGKKVIEIRPNIPWDKGYAILRILKLYRANNRSFIIFIGDDKTDEDAFKLLSSRAVTIRVGRNQSSNAKYYVHNPSEVMRLFTNIISLKHKPPDRI